MDVINAFLSGMNCESLIHKLGCLKPCSTHDLLNVAMNNASDEEAVGAVFNGGRDKGPSTQRGKKNKKDRRRPANSALVAMADRMDK